MFRLTDSVDFVHRIESDPRLTDHCILFLRKKINACFLGDYWQDKESGSLSSASLFHAPSAIAFHACLDTAANMKYTEQNEQEKSPPAVRDIVNASGYSLGTVSHALNHQPGVAPETRAHIFEVAHELGYPVRLRSNYSPVEEIKTVALLIKQDNDLP